MELLSYFGLFVIWIWVIALSGCYCAKDRARGICGGCCSEGLLLDLMQRGDVGLLQSSWEARVSSYQCLSLCKAVQARLGLEMNPVFSVSFDCPARSVL